jgi:hypothetical protein
MRALLIFLLLFVALTAIPCGMMLVFEPNGSLLQLPLDVLGSTPFHSFLIPGVFLSIMVGGLNAIASVMCMFKKPFQYRWAMAAGVMLSLWILSQWAMISGFHWLQFFCFGIGILITLIAYQLRGKWAV